MVEPEKKTWSPEQIKEKIAELIKKYPEYMSKSFEETFLGGGSFTGKEELEIQDKIRENTEKAISTDKEVITEEINQKYGGIYSLSNAIIRRSLGNKEVGEKDKSSESLTQQKMYDFFANIPEKPKTVKVKQPSKTTHAILQAKEGAKIATQLAFYSYMFFGVQNVFGIVPDAIGNFGIQLPNAPDAIIGTMPFYSLQRLERGISDRILKYRAIGDVFLAHQRGGTDTLRLDMTLFGPFKAWYLLYLLALQQGGESVLKDLNINFTGEIALTGEEINIPKTGKLKYESHMTYPIITNTAIMLDMFLQTIEWHQEKDMGGHEVIYVHLLFRKHVDPQSLSVFDEDSGEGNLFYGDTLNEKRRKELLYDTMWKVKEIGMEVMKFGLFGASDMVTLDMEAITSDPYVVDIAKVIGGYSYDINNINSVTTAMGG